MYSVGGCYRRVINSVRHSATTVGYSINMSPIWETLGRSLAHMLGSLHLTTCTPSVNVLAPLETRLCRESLLSYAELTLLGTYHYNCIVRYILHTALPGKLNILFRCHVGCLILGRIGFKPKGRRCN